jgi:hypothetical protein
VAWLLHAGLQALLSQHSLTQQDEELWRGRMKDLLGAWKGHEFTRDR